VEDADVCGVAGSAWYFPEVGVGVFGGGALDEEELGEVEDEGAAD